MPEVFRLCDRISVLRDGRYVGSLAVKEATEDIVVQMMIGRAVAAFRQPPAPRPQGHDPERAAPELAGEVPGRLVYPAPGEIVGSPGWSARAAAKSHARLRPGPARHGRGAGGGPKLKLGSIHASMRRGIGLVPEDRKRQGLVLMMCCQANLTLAMLDAVSLLGFLSDRAENRVAAEYFQKLRVKTPSLDTPVAACPAAISRRS